MNNTSDMCQLAERVLTPTFRAIVAAEITVATVAIVPNAMLMSAVRHVTVFPSNLRLLLGHLSFVLLLFCSGIIVKGVYLLTTSACSFSISKRMCKLLEMLEIGITLPNMNYVLVSLCLERLYATVRYRSYDKARDPWLATVLIGCGWIVSFLLNNGQNLGSLPSDQYVPFCDATFISTSSPYLFPVNVFVELMAVLITLLVFFYNRRIARNMAVERSTYDLSSRFLVDQNVQINAILLPSVAVHLVCFLSIFVSLIPMGWTGDWALSFETKAWLQHSTFLWRLIYALIDPGIAFRFNGHLRQHLLKSPVGSVMKKLGIWFGKGEMKEAFMPAVTQTSLHFAYLKQMWAKPGVSSLENLKHQGADSFRRTLL